MHPRLFFCHSIYTKMYGVTVAYYVYMLILVLAVISLMSTAALGGIPAMLIGFVLALPGLLFVGWIFLILGECRKCLVDYQLLKNK